MDSDDFEGEDTVRTTGFAVGKRAEDLSGSLTCSKYC